MKINGKELNYFDVKEITGSIYGESQHSKRIESIACAALGVIASTSLIVHRIGRGMAAELNLIDKHAVKQVDRLLSNEKFDVESSQEKHVLFLIGGRKEIRTCMDWTDFDSDGQTTLSISMITDHGRATPLLWKTFSKKGLKNNRNGYEDELLKRLRKMVPEDVKVTIIADRGFCDTKLMRFLKEELKFEYTIRIRSNILVNDGKNESRLANEYVSASGKSKTIRKALITKEGYEVETFVAIKAKRMKQAWCIVSSDEKISGSGVVKWYAKRWGCEPQFRDMKDIYLGMGLSKTHIQSAKKRDRLLFIHAISVIILTFLGATCERIGLDKYLKINTSKKRTLSLFNQGAIIFNRIARMAKETLEKLLNSFYELMNEHKTLIDILGTI